MIMKKKQKKLIDRLLAAGEFKGQKQQDQWVLFEVLDLKRNGYFLDLAAADGITHSNSYVLEKHFDWDGLCIEPNPYFNQQLAQHRNCRIETSVVSDKEELVEFRIDNGQLGGIVAPDTDNNEAVRGGELPNARIVSMQAKTINDVLAAHEVPAVIDYFSLDIEGSEERIISSLDFDRYQFRCITIERPTPKVNEVLFENGYVFVRNVQYDTFYVHHTVKKKRKIVCDPFEQVPYKDW